mgnify:CR=1 FL=1
MAARERPDHGDVLQFRTAGADRPRGVERHTEAGARAKLYASQVANECADEAMQVFGGAGYLRGARVERIYRETKVLTIGGGSLEIMKDLAAKQLGM